LREETQHIVAELERLSGLPVRVVPAPDLAVMGKVTMSPHVTGSYLIQYRPGIPFKDYVVAVQCGHVLRLLSLPELQRCQFATGAAALSWGSQAVKAFRKTSGQAPLPEPVLAGFAEQLIAGLFTQLRSIPIGMRIDAWLAAEYPTLGDEQAESLAVQQQEAVSCLGPQVRSVVPDEIISSSILLNTAHALFCDRLLGITQFQVPYVASGFKEMAEALLRIFDDLPADPSSDRALVDHWAKEIGLDGKYTWIPVPSTGVAVP